MTKFLSQALAAREPAFSQGIQQLERAAGAPGADIRLTAEVVQNTRSKITQLGLDPSDTTGQELYQALALRLGQDEVVVRQALGVEGDASADDMVAKVVKFIDDNDSYKNCFALKASVAKRLLKKKPPKLAMKRLGYRSIDSMLKHESVPSLYAAALITESEQWHKSYRDQYAKLRPSDFEVRKISLVHPKTKRWQELADGFIGDARHNILTFPELGAVVTLPISKSVDGLTIITLLMVSEEMNRIRANSSFIKLQQVKPDFGKLVQTASITEPYTTARMASQTVPWRMIQRYYSRYQDAYHAEIFEPHVQPDDLKWGSGEALLASLDGRLEFWQGCENLGFMGEDGAIVSCNALDVALSHCNKMPYTNRVVHFVRDNLWHELMMRYLHQENLETAVRQQLAGDLAGGIEA